MKQILPALCFRLVDSLGGFTTSVDPLLAVLMDCLTEAIAVADLGSDMWSYPRLRSSTGFRFSNVGSSSGDQNVVEARYTKR